MDILIFTVIIAFYLYGVVFTALYIQNKYDLNEYTLKSISNKSKIKAVLFIRGSWLSLVYSFINRNR